LSFFFFFKLVTGKVLMKEAFLENDII
jgi:hypothetical protein